MHSPRASAQPRLTKGMHRKAKQAASQGTEDKGRLGQRDANSKMCQQRQVGGTCWHGVQRSVNSRRALSACTALFPSQCTPCTSGSVQPPPHLAQ